MLNFKIEDLLENNSFFSDIDSSFESVKDNCDDEFGEDYVIYYFYRRGYNLTFVGDEKGKKLTSEQIEITLRNKIDNEYLKEITSLDDFKLRLKNDIDSIYSDGDGEDVAFLKNGVTLYYNNGFLNKITSNDQVSRDFVVNHLTKIELNNRTD